MNYDYYICGKHIRFSIPWRLKITAEAKPFLTESESQPDLPVNFLVVDSLPTPKAGGIWYIDSYYLPDEQGQRVWHSAERGNPPYCCVIWEKESHVTCYCLRGEEKQIIYTKNLIELIGLEFCLLRLEAFILHAALIDWQGKGILFCAPSGTGKSTQAALWQQYMGSKTLNGDRAGIRYDAGVWKAWGIPFAGTSGIYCNESVPIHAVVLLGQGSNNILSAVPPSEAFKRMLPECNAQRWNAAFMDKLMGLLSAFACGVPVYRLECQPNLGAVEVLYKGILKED